MIKDRDEAIERLDDWASRRFGAGYSQAWAANFYAESLRDMTAASVLNSDAEWGQDEHISYATDLTHAMIERLTGE